MSTVQRDDSPETGSSFQLDMGINGLVKVDVFRAVSKEGKPMEEVLLEVSAHRASDSVIDNIIVGLQVGDAISLANALQFATKTVMNDRAKRAEEGR